MLGNRLTTVVACIVLNFGTCEKGIEVRFRYTSWLASAFALASGFASSAACADTRGDAAPSIGPTTSALDIDAKSMFFIILILAISFAWIRALPLIDRLEAWLTRE